MIYYSFVMLLYLITLGIINSVWQNNQINWMYVCVCVCVFVCVILFKLTYLKEKIWIVLILLTKYIEIFASNS